MKRSPRNLRTKSYKAISAVAKVILLSLVAFLAASPAAAQSEDLSLVSGRVAVQYPAGRSALARQAAETATFAMGRILKGLGISVEGQVNIRLVPNHDEFNMACGSVMPEWSLAAALPPDAIVVNISKSTPSTANDIHLSMVHEMVHLALAQVEASRGERLPLWFHEGAATLLSGRQPLMPSRSIFRTAATHGNLIPLDQIAESFPQEQQAADLAYLQSEDFIAWVSKNSPEGLAGIMDRFKSDVAFEDAFVIASGMTIADAEAKWAASLRKRLPWLRSLLASLTFWGVMAVSTILVYLVVRARSQRQKRIWEEEERVFSVLDLEEPPDDEPDEDDEPEQEWDPGEPIHG